MEKSRCRVLKVGYPSVWNRSRIHQSSQKQSCHLQEYQISHGGYKNCHFFSVGLVFLEIAEINKIIFLKPHLSSVPNSWYRWRWPRNTSPFPIRPFVFNIKTAANNRSSAFSCFSKHIISYNYWLLSLFDIWNIAYIIAFII